MNVIKSKSFCTVNETSDKIKIKRQPTEWEKYQQMT